MWVASMPEAASVIEANAQLPDGASGKTLLMVIMSCMQLHMA